MTPARLCLVLSLLSCACSAGGRSVNPDADPSGSELEQASGDSLPIVAVPQRLPSADPWEWRFDPRGRQIASEFIDDDRGVAGCGIWDIESGSLVRAHVYPEFDDSEDFLNPCIDWVADPRIPSDTSADGKLRAEVVGGLEIEVVDGPRRSVRGCASCDDAMAWAPSGHQLATCNGTLLEIWDGDTGKRLRSDTLGLGDVVETLIGWTDEGIGVIVLHQITAPCDQLEPDSDYCNDYDYGYTHVGDDDDDPGPTELHGYALSTFWWPAAGGSPIARSEIHKSTEMPDFHADVGVRWLAFVRELYFDRDGSSTTVHVYGVGPRQSQLGWTESSEEEWSEPWDGYWRVDASTQWIEGLTWGTGSDYEGSLELGWNAIVAEPNPAFHHGSVITIHGGGPWGEIEVLAASSGAAVTRWEACTDDGEEECKSGGPPVGDCDLLDVSPLLSLALVECEAGLQLIDAGGRGSTMARLRYDATEWLWGRSNLLALLESDGKLGVVDLSTGKTLYERNDVLELLSIPLAAEQERLALDYADRLEIIAWPTGARIIEVPGEWEAAALSPDGSKLATLGGAEVRVLDIQSGATISTSPVGDAYGIAWRQDGAALFYGPDVPSHAIDPKTGMLLYELFDPILEACSPEEIDPSWRWIHRPDNSVTRTLDFARIELGPGWARIDSGMFEGELDALPANLRFRIGDDPDAPAIYTAADLEPWLRSPGLLRDFFAGKPLPSPRIPVEAQAKLEQRRNSSRPGDRAENSQPG